MCLIPGVSPYTLITLCVVTALLLNCDMYIHVHYESYFDYYVKMTAKAMYYIVHTIYMYIVYLHCI